MDSSLGQTVGAVAPRHEPSRDQHRDEHAAQPKESVHLEESSLDDPSLSGLPISHGRFELPTELFSVLLKDAQALLPA